jgi:hypothetical protein
MVLPISIIKYWPIKSYSSTGSTNSTRYWHTGSTDSNTVYTTDFKRNEGAWWDYLHNNVHTGIASGEGARRNYSAKQFSITRVPTVFFPLVRLVDTRFFDSQENVR